MIAGLILFILGIIVCIWSVFNYSTITFLATASSTASIVFGLLCIVFGLQDIVKSIRGVPFVG